MNFLLNQDLNNMKLSDAPTEILGLGGQVVLIGMLTVFAVLGLLWACLTVFKIVFHDIPAKKSGKAVIEKKSPESFVAPVAVQSSDDEIVAVIAAAIAAAESESGGAVKFRVVSFRRR
ncbi:MAG: hypothetical protein E7673_04795 [Ruminococcaceae bacterium]|nr:hypothetical protein [Oscillospiraceae bacterium]